MVLYITLLALPSSRPECHTREMHCLCIHIMVFGVVIYSNHKQQLTQICETVLNNSISLSSNIFIIINNIEFLPMTVSVTVSARGVACRTHVRRCFHIDLTIKKKN